jgi:hypothetical protein
MVEKDQSGYKKTMEIVRKYYGDGTPLSEERELFDVIRTARGLSEGSARRILAEIERHARGMDAKKIDIKKSNLIKDINYTFGQGFFTEHRVPDYRLMASIQLVIDAARQQGRLTESLQRVQLEEGLIRYMMSKGSFQESTHQRSEVDAVVMAMVAKRFDEKYSKSLSKNQKSLLEKYLRYQVTGDHKPLREFVMSESVRIRDALNKAMTMKEFIEDREMMKRLNEVQTKLTNFANGEFPDERIEETMMYQKLVEEVESNE